MKFLLKFNDEDVQIVEQATGKVVYFAHLGCCELAFTKCLRLNAGLETI